MYRLAFDIDVSEAFRAVTVAALSAELAVVYVLAAMARNAVRRCLELAARFCSVAVVTPRVFMRAVDLEAGLFVMIEQPVLPGVRVVTGLAVDAEARLVNIIRYMA